MRKVLRNVLVLEFAKKKLRKSSIMNSTNFLIKLLYTESGNLILTDIPKNALFRE